MPSEAARFQRRLGSRDRWFMLIVVLVTAAFIIGIVVDGLGPSEKTSATRCVGVKSAGFMGGIITQHCGAQATAVCRSDAGRRGELPKQCARLVPALRP
jgi:hypothetical protein